MSSDSSSGPDYVKDAIADNFQDLPASTYTDAEDESAQPVKSRLFNRQRSLHQILGGGKAAESLLWRNKLMSVGILGCATILYLVFEYSGCNFLSIVCNVLLVTLGVLFAWSNTVSFLNKSPPPLPDLQVSEDAAISLALALRMEINKVLVIARDIALGKDFKLFLKVMGVLWGLSVVGGWFHILTLLYLGVLVSHTIPVIYETYEDQIELYAKQGYEQAQKHYKKVDETVLSKIFNAFPKLKKSD